MTDPSEAETLEQWCNTLLAAGKTHSAKLFAKTLALDKSVNTLILLAKCNMATGDTDAALGALEEARNLASTSEERAIASILWAEILSKQNNLAAALKAVKQAEQSTIELNQETRDRLAYAKFSLLSQMGDIRQARAGLEREFSFSFGDGETSTSNLFWQPDYEQREKLRPARFKYQALINPPKELDPAFVYVLSGGLAECRLLATRFASQIHALAGPDAHLHIDGVVTGKDDDGHSSLAWTALKNKLKRLNPSPTITLTLSEYNFDHLRSEQMSALKRCAVYAALPELMEQYNCPIVVSGFECFPMLNPTPKFNGKSDVQILEGERVELDILSQLSPSLLHLNNTREAKKFATALRDYITPFFSETDKLSPGLDRAALTSAHLSSPHANLSILPATSVEKDETCHSPWAFYEGTASYIHTSKQQSFQDFALFLRQNQSDFTIPILARTMGYSGKLNKAIAIIDLHLTENKKKDGPKNFELLLLKALFLAQSGQLRAAQSHLRAAQEQVPASKPYKDAKLRALYQLGSVSAALGDIAEAQDIFDKRIAVGCGNGLDTHTGIINLNPPAPKPKAVPEISIETIKSSDQHSQYVYLVSADLVYCEIFAPALIKTFGKIAPSGCHLHIHGLAEHTSLENNAAAQWNFVREHLSNLGISNSFSFGTLDTEKLSLWQRKAVFSSERFRILPQLLETFQRPVIVADIDQLPLGDPGTILDPEVDVQLLRYPDAVLNFLSVTSATLSVFHPTATGKAYAKGIASYLSAAYAQPESIDWHLDQAALTALAYTVPNDTTISYLDPKRVVSDPHETSPQDAAKDGALFWSITNSISGNLTALRQLDNAVDLD